MVVDTIFPFLLILRFFFYFHGKYSVVGGCECSTTPLLPVIVNSPTQYCIISSKVFFVVHCEAMLFFEYDSYVLDDYSKPVKGGVMC